MRMRALRLGVLFLVVTTLAACSAPQATRTSRPPSHTPTSGATEQTTPQHTSTPPSEEATSTSKVKPSHTVVPTDTPEPPSRILTDQGQTSAVLRGSLEDGDADRFVLLGEEGQTLDIAVETPGEVGLAIWGADGIPLKRRIDEETSWREELPSTQDTFIEVSALETANYTLTVSLLAPSLPASLEVIQPDGGEVWLEGSSHTIAWRSSGVQLVDVEVASGGKPLGHLALGLDADAGHLTWDIPVGLISDFGVASSNAMRVQVSSSDDPEVFDENDEPFTVHTPRIQFGTGATSATVTGTLATEGGSYRYVLGVSIGQRMEIEVLPADVEVALWGAEDGSTWQIPAGQQRLAVPELPATQDYFVTLTSPGSAQAVDYEMDVVIR